MMRQGAPDSSAVARMAVGRRVSTGISKARKKESEDNVFMNKKG